MPGLPRRGSCNGHQIEGLILHWPARYRKCVGLGRLEKIRNDFVAFSACELMESGFPMAISVAG